MNLEKALNAALNAAQKSRRILKGYFGQHLEIREKPGQGLVSNADQESERIIRSELEARFEKAGFLGEESGLSQVNDTDLLWIVDPLDGTHNFVSGLPLYCTSIALAQGREVLVGVVDVPELDTVFHAVKGRGAFQNGKPIRVNPKPMKEVLLATGFAYQKGDVLDEQVYFFRKFLHQALGVRRPGAAALDLCWVASGAFGGFWERGLSPWDVAAGGLLVQEAGGIVTDYSGNPFRFDQKTVVASAPQLHAEMLGILAESPSKN